MGIGAPHKGNMARVNLCIWTTDMTTFDTTKTIAGHHGNGGIAGRFFSAFTSWNKMRVTRHELSKLTDRELDDIGLARGDIDQFS